jgi:hypothetical protein
VWYWPEAALMRPSYVTSTSRSMHKMQTTMLKPDVFDVQTTPLDMHTQFNPDRKKK